MMTDADADDLEPRSGDRFPGVRTFVKILDDYGLDAGLGFLLPGVGDVLTGTGSIALLFTAVKEKVPTVILFKMLLNILIDTVFGIVPVVGDLFDLFFRANRRNLELIERYGGDGDEEPDFGDYAIVGLGVILVLASILIPAYFLFGIANAWVHF